MTPDEALAAVAFQERELEPGEGVSQRGIGLSCPSCRHSSAPPAARSIRPLTFHPVVSDLHRRAAVRPSIGPVLDYVGGLRNAHSNKFRRLATGLTTIETTPAFGIGQRAILARTPAGNVLWECLALIDDATVDLLKGLGGVAAIAISHPHYYTTMVEWSRALGGVPIYLHAADRQWVMRADPAVHFWEGDTKPIGPGLALVRLGGHFDGGTSSIGRTGTKVVVYCSLATSSRWSRAGTSALCGPTRT